MDDDAIRRLSAAAILLLVLALTACSGAVGSAAPTASSPARSSVSLEGTSAPAVDLLPVVWHVTGAADADRDTYLLFTAGEVEILEPKGFVLLGWVTQGDAMLAQVDGWAQSLGTEHAPTAPWLTSAAFFRRVGDGWVLLDARGGRLARLQDDGPAPKSKVTITTPEPVTAFVRERLADAVPGPGTRSVGLAAIVGRWRAEGLDAAHALLTIDSDGRWRLIGGCASGTGEDLGGSGTLRLLPHGSLLIAAAPVAGVGCVPAVRKPPADAAALVSFTEARSAAVVDGRLTLFDRRGHRIGQLVRQP